MSTTPTATRPAGLIANALCRLGGMSPELVDELPASRGQFINTACAMLGVGALGLVSLSYALTSTNVVPDWRAAALIGLFWGTLVIVIDRLMIISMRRNPAKGWRNVVPATAGFLVRLAVAVVIGTVVSMPLVLKVFDREIAAQVQADIVQTRTAAAARLDADFADIPKLEQQVDALNKQISSLPFYDPATVNPAYGEAKAVRDTAKSACESANDAAAAEAAGRAGTGRTGYGPEWQRLAGVADEKCKAYKAAQAAFNKVSQNTQAEYERTVADAQATATTDRDRINVVLAGRRAERSAQEQVLYGAINSSDGLASRLESLDHLSSASPAIAAGRLFLALMLMMVEIMPVFSKFLKTIGPADDYAHIEMKREESRAKDEEIYQADREKATRTRSSVQDQSARDWVSKQLAVECDLNTAAVAVSKEIELERLEVWKEGERAKNASVISQARAKLSHALALTPSGRSAKTTPAPQQALGLNAP